MLAGGAVAAYRWRTELAIQFWPIWHLKRCANQHTAFGRWAWQAYGLKRHAAMRAIEATVAQREQRIRAELATLDQTSWAGAYWATGGHGGGPTLFLAPEGGFTYYATSCTSTECNYGDVVEVNDDSIVLRPVLDCDLYDVGPGRNLVRIEWQGARLLSPLETMTDFLNDVNAGACRVPPGWSLLRAGDKPALVRETPRVPEAYQRHIMDHPLKAVVERVSAAQDVPTSGSERCEQVLLTLSIGERDGVFVGMVLYPIGVDEFDAAVVRSMTESGCEAEYEGCFKAGEPVHMPVVGWTFTTSGPDADQECLNEYWLEDLEEESAEVLREP